VWRLELQHHDRDQDGEDAVAERFQAGLAHRGVFMVFLRLLS
jgi:hypothetical protein